MYTTPCFPKALLAPETVGVPMAIPEALRPQVIQPNVGEVTFHGITDCSDSWFSAVARWIQQFFSMFFWLRMVVRWLKMVNGEPVFWGIWG